MINNPMKYPIINEDRRREMLDVPVKRLRLIIDTDAKNEVDDQFAIAWAVCSQERFDVEAIYAAPFHHACFDQFNKTDERILTEECRKVNGKSKDPKDGMEQSYQEVMKILSMLNEPFKGSVLKGSGEYLKNKEQPVISEAAEDLIKRARAAEEPIYIAAIGALTNLASAILMAPDIIERIVIVWLGGHELSFGHGIEFNLIQDVYAAQIVFDSGVPMIWIPCNNVAAMLSISSAELKDCIADAGPIGYYLAETVLKTFDQKAGKIAYMKLLRNSSLKDNTDQSENYLAKFKTEHIAWSRIIWDIAAIAILKNPNWITSKMIKAPLLCDDYSWNEGNDDRHMIRVATFCHRDMIFGDMIACLKKASEQKG